ncbi:MAG: hypothetical protein HF962_00140 [Sulfurovum sp.]|nr:hypothetical protein [Sulfurovum sp.]
MKPFGYFITLLLGITITVSASTIRDVKILEASENIKYITQGIAKNYIYLYIYPNKDELKATISNSIENLEENIRIIAINTKDTKTKYILDFFAFEKEQLKILLEKKQSAVAAGKVLDFSEALTEGAENISNSIRYDFTFEEKMFMRSKNIGYLVEKLSKYYMVLASDIDKTTIQEKVKQTIGLVEDDMNQMRQYIYPKNLDKKKQDIAKFWELNKYYYTTIDSLKIPSIVLLSTSGLQDIMNKIAIHHGKGE